MAVRVSPQVGRSHFLLDLQNLFYSTMKVVNALPNYV